MSEQLEREGGVAVQDDRSHGPLEYRSATLGEVSYPKRLIELIVMPYEQEALVEYGGRMVSEICTRGAFDGIQVRPGRVKVNRDHDVTRTCGKAVTFHPSRDDGLIAEIRMSPTMLGDETLTLADDGILDASAGFLPMLWKHDDAEIWESRNRRRLNHVWLGHIALVPDPAYIGAEVLAVRSKPDLPAADEGGTPNLDQVRAWLQQDRYSEIQ